MAVYLVGGAVRDKLLNLPVHERDWVVVGAHPQELIAKGYQQVGKDFPVFLHPTTREEYALARTERKSGQGHTEFAVHASPEVTLEDDLIRRDLTINAIAEDEQGRLIDPHHGVRDINARLLRHVSDAFTEDPLRVLRVARFAARFAHLGFRVAEETQQLLQRMSDTGELQQLVPERVWREWEKSLHSEQPAVFLVLLKEINALQQVLPGMTASQQQIHRLERTARYATSPLLRFASLFIHEATPDDITAFCRRLAIPNPYRDAALLARQQETFICESKLPDPVTLFTLLRHIDFWRRPEKLAQLLQLRAAEWFEQPQYTKVSEQHAQLTQAAAAAAQVNAKTLQQTGLTGKALGQALQQQREHVLTEALR